MPRLAKTVLAVAMFSAVLAVPAEARWRAQGSPSQSLKAASTQKLVKQAKQALAPGGGRVDLSPILRELAARLPKLHGSERTQARGLLLRPTDPGPQGDPQGDDYSVAEATPVCSAHFCVHYVTTTPDAPPTTDTSPANGVPDYVERTRDAAEESYTVENGQLGWRTPKSDGMRGGDSRTDVYLKQLGNSGIYGYSAPDPGQTPGADNSVYAYLVVDDDFNSTEFPGYDSPNTPLRVTLAHEYNHILQYTYDFLQDTWMLESTAVWMEGKVAPEAYDYLQYLNAWVQLTTLPLTSFNGGDPSDRDNLKVYGTAVWNKWLENRFDSEVIRRAWEVSLLTARPSFAVEAYDRAIRDKGGVGFADEFDRFAAATAEWQSQNSGFPEGSRYQDVDRVGTATVNGEGGSVQLDHTGYALVTVAGASNPRVKLSMRAPAGTKAALALVGRIGSGSGSQAVVALKELPRGGSGNVVVDNPSRFSRLTAVLVNSDSRVVGSSQITGDWVYGRDNQLYYARMSTDFTGPRVTKRSPGSGARRVKRRPTVKVTFNERVLGVSTKSLRLLGPNGRGVGARVRFTRGARTATLTPRRKLGSRARYTVRVTRSVTDTALNPLRSTTTWSFVTGK